MGLTDLFISNDMTVRHLADRISVFEETGPGGLFRRPMPPHAQVPPVAAPMRRVGDGEFPGPPSPPAGWPFHPRLPWATDHSRAMRPARRSSGVSHGG